MPKIKLVFFVSEDWFFKSHFMERAVAAVAAGYEVVFVGNLGIHRNAIGAAGIRCVPVGISRGSINPFADARLIRQLIRIYRSESPDIVHHVAMKPILYGTLAALATGRKAIINAPVGMGFVFTSMSTKARLLRPLLNAAYRWLLNPRYSYVVFENKDDLAELVSKRMLRADRAVLIRGAGVNVDEFVQSEVSTQSPDLPVRVLLPARMLWDKGVGEYVAAAEKLVKAGVNAEFLMAGMSDHKNPAAIAQATLEMWNKQGYVRWLGHCDNMAKLMGEVDIICLPSYREGLPKVLLEAAACARPIVTTDVQGCREVVVNEENGSLVPPRTVEELAVAMGRLIGDPALREAWGKAGRRRVVEHFSTEIVVAATLGLYNRALKERKQ